MITHISEHILQLLQTDPRKALKLFWDVVSQLLEEDVANIYFSDIKCLTSLSTLHPILDYGFTQEGIDNLIKLIEKIMTYYQSEEVKSKVQAEKRERIVDRCNTMLQELHYIYGDTLLNKGSFEEACNQYHRGCRIAHKDFECSEIFKPQEEAFSKQLKEFVSFLSDRHYPPEITERVKYNIDSSIGRAQFLVVDPNTDQNEGYILSMEVEAQAVATETKLSWKAGLQEKLADEFLEQVSLAPGAISSCLVEQGYECGLRADITYKIDFPDCLTPLRGRSNGLGTVVAIVSGIAKTQMPQCIAITGEIDCDGRVNWVGGIESKIKTVDSDMRITTVILPKDNLDEARQYAENLDLVGVSETPRPQGGASWRSGSEQF